MEATICGTEGRIIIHLIWHGKFFFSIIGHNEEKKKYNPIKRGIGYTHEIQECKMPTRKQDRERTMDAPNSLDLVKLLDDTRDKIGLQFK